jgi:hypothetical protein
MSQGRKEPKVPENTCYQKVVLQVAQEGSGRGAQSQISGGVLLLYVDAKSGERNEAMGLLERPAQKPSF